ncbi:MAG: RNA 3'-phosphate cyclase [Candidatus Brocadiaceae bacterium]|nr:RNA 3'-phosphate cyclase [Candidatus Brocadiaceae bacterium]
MHSDIIEIDGSFGEGGGQILRTALSLSAITKKPFTIYNIRARRKPPGLSYQHLQAVNAITQICNARVAGNHLRSTCLEFYPGSIEAGTYHFNIGTAGSVSLVLQTILYPLSLTAKPSFITITGGTHVTHCPCMDYLSYQWLYFLKKIGFDAEIEIHKAGFYPRGGGEVFAKITARKHSLPLKIAERGRLLQVTGISAVSNLEMNIARRQQLQAQKRLDERDIPCRILLKHIPSSGKGSMLLLLGKFEYSQCCYFSLGAIGKRAEMVADEACNGLFSFLNTEGSIDEFLADQLIIPLALTKATSRFVTPMITQHLLTNIETVKLFLPVTVHLCGEFSGKGVVDILN